MFKKIGTTLISSLLVINFTQIIWLGILVGAIMIFSQCLWDERKSILSLPKGKNYMLSLIASIVLVIIGVSWAGITLSKMSKARVEQDEKAKRIVEAKTKSEEAEKLIEKLKSEGKAGTSEVAIIGNDIEGNKGTAIRATGFEKARLGDNKIKVNEGIAIDIDSKKPETK